MLLFIIFILLLAFAFFSHALLFGLLRINYYKLRSDARSGGIQAKRLYPLHQRSNELLVMFVSVSALIHLALYGTMLALFPTIIVILISPVIILFSSFLLPILYADRFGVTLLARFSPLVQKALRYTGTILKPLARLLGKTLDTHAPRELGSKQELYSLLEKHSASEDSVIAQHEIELVRGSLDFGQKIVRDFMTPRRIVKRIAIDEDVGPVVIDELHTSGHSRFPVYSGKQVDVFVGILFLRDLVDVKAGGKVKEFMKRTVMYIHEEESLDYALHVCLSTNQQLLIVVNTFEEFVGVISIEDMLEQIIGSNIIDEFDRHDDLRAVAASMAEKEAKKRASTDKK